VEDETFSCGTGVVASAIVYYIDENQFDNKDFSVKVITKGGELSVKFEFEDGEGFEKVRLIGPAEKVFEGIYEL
jgi:diaminopimelate epimerase